MYFRLLSVAAAVRLLSVAAAVRLLSVAAAVRLLSVTAAVRCRFLLQRDRFTQGTPLEIVAAVCTVSPIICTEGTNAFRSRKHALRLVAFSHSLSLCLVLKRPCYTSSGLEGNLAFFAANVPT